MIQRFTEISPPLEQRIETGVFQTVLNAVQTVVRIHSSLNETVNDGELSERTTNAVFRALQPGSLPFRILVAAVCVWIVRILNIRAETRRILDQHGHHAHASAPNSKHS